MKIKEQKFQLTTEITLLGTFLLLIIFFSLFAPYFFSIRNFLNIGLYSSIIGISAVGMTMVLLIGHIDISVGAVMGMIGVVAAQLFRTGMHMSLVMVITLSIGVLVGIFNGILVTKMKISSLIVTLATMTIFRGLAFVFCSGLSIVITSPSCRYLGRGYVIGLPVAMVIMVFLYVFFAYILKNTTFGRRVYATGGNPEASYYSGINIEKITILVFVMSGVFAALAGLISASQTGSGQPRAGQGYEMNIIAATVLGGTSLNGGKGKVYGTLVGVLIMGTLSNGMVLMNIPSFYQEIATGCVLLIAVMIDSIRTKRSGT